MLPFIENDWLKFLAVVVMLVAIFVGYRKGRDEVSAGGQSRAWTHIPLIAFAIASLGPSIFAVMIYLGYKSGVIQPPSSGFRFSTLILRLPFEFAILNWEFVALYLVCRLRPNFGSARLAMWLSVIAMSVPNVLLFSTAWEMLSSARDAGQGIGFIEAMLILPIFAMIWSGPFPAMFNAYGIEHVLSALTAPIPFLGLIGWLAGQLIGWSTSHFRRKATETF